MSDKSTTASRRDFLATGALAASGLAMTAAPSSAAESPPPTDKKKPIMNTVTTRDGVSIFYKDWGTGQPIVFSHGWPLSSDDWDAQLLFFLSHGYRVIAMTR